MLKKLLITAAMLGQFGVAAQAAEIWVVTEGTSAPARGTWQVTADGKKVSGSADMINARGQHVTFKLAGTVSNDAYDLQRVNASDGSVCMYKGSMKTPGKISGSAVCGASSTAWNVTRN